MLNLDQFIDSCAHETKVIQHLATRIPDGALDYRPTEGQRSTLELMRYMTRMSAVLMSYAVEGSWDRAAEIGKATESVTPKNFHEEMDRQMELIREEAAKIADRPLDDTPCAMPWGEPCTLGQFLVNAPLKIFPAYRMQFFLYLKAAGATDLGTANCWAGVDMPPLQTE